MPWPPALRIRASASRVCVEHPRFGVLFDEPASLVAAYDARWGEHFVAAGEDAQRIEERGIERDPAAPPPTGVERVARVVPVDAAPWRGDSDDRRFDPWAHHGERVVLRPLDPPTFDALAAAALLQHAWSRALRALRVGRGILKRLSPRGRTVIELDVPALSDADRQALARHCGMHGLRIEGCAVVLRPFSQLAAAQWRFALLSLLLALPLVWRFARRGRVPGALLVMLALVALASWTALRDARRLGAAHLLSREALARVAARRAARDRFRALPPGDDASAYEGSGSFRLGGTWAAPFAALIACAAALAMLFLPRPPASGARLAASLVLLVAGFVAGALLGEVLVGVRLALGSAGLLIRPRGVWSSPLYVPYPAMGSAVAVPAVGNRPAELRLVLQDGATIALVVQPPLAWRAEPVALAAEEAILARLGVPRPFRDAAEAGPAAS